MNKCIYTWIVILLFMIGCVNNDNTKLKKNPSENIYYESLFGETYLTQGVFFKDQKDSTETKSWLYTNLDRPLVLYGNYENGLPLGVWNFGLKDGTLMASQWDIYKNNITPCTFSIPFKCEQTQVDSSSFKLTTMNDSLGKITIVVHISNHIEKEENLEEYVLQSEAALKEAGYTFKSKKREIKKNENRYFFTEYSLKDSADRRKKVFYLYGNTPSQKHFVEFTLYHEGQKEDLVKIIYNLMATSLYIDNERFFNPYKNNRD